RWRFDIGVFTNLTRDHLNAHGSWEHYLASKAQLFAHLPDEGAAILNACDPASALVEQVIRPQVRRARYAVPSRGSAEGEVDLTARRVRLDPEGTEIELEPSPLADALGGKLRTRLVGAIFAENALAAAVAGLRAGIDASAVARGIADCPVVPGRFEIVHRA